jgi:hypothetical protein
MYEATQYISKWSDAAIENCFKLIQFQLVLLKYNSEFRVIIYKSIIV